MKVEIETDDLASEGLCALAYALGNARGPTRGAEQKIYRNLLACIHELERRDRDSRDLSVLWELADGHRRAIEAARKLTV